MGKFPTFQSQQLLPNFLCEHIEIFYANIFAQYCPDLFIKSS